MNEDQQVVQERRPAEQHSNASEEQQMHEEAQKKVDEKVEKIPRSLD